MLYLDFNATTPVDPRVLGVVDHVLRNVPGNASSRQHLTGQAAAEHVEKARHQVADLVGALPSEVIFTSGASEALTVAILGVALANKGRPDVVVGATEHKAALAAAEMATRLSGGQLRMAPVLPSGQVDLAAFDDLLDDRVGVACVMHANNETGVIHPVEDVIQTARAAGALSVCDLTQSAGKEDVAEAGLRADLRVLSSHKIYGPKGAGALVATREVQARLVPVLAGGGQERGLRGGTHNTPAIAGFGAAAEIAAEQWSRDSDHYEALCQRFLAAIRDRTSGVFVNGEAAPRLANTLNIRFEGADADAVMASAPTVEVSTGSACQGAVTLPSHVLTAMGLGRSAAEECIRVSVGRTTTADVVDEAAYLLASAVERVRSLTAA